MLNYRVIVLIITFFFILNVFVILTSEFGSAMNIGEIITYREPKTGINVSKEIKGDIYTPKISYHIKTPKVDSFNFVLALDTSGSMGVQGNELEGYAIEGAVPKFVNTIAKEYCKKTRSEFNISIIGFSDKIDFAYFDYNNKNPSTAYLKSVSDLVNNNQLFEKFEQNFKMDYNPDETAYTDFSNAILASGLILDTDKKRNTTNFRSTKRFIIIVTGKGEFKPVDKDLLNKTIKEYSIYVIGMDIPLNTRLYKQIVTLANNTNDNYRIIAAGEIQLKTEFEETLKEAIKNLEESLNETLNGVIEEPIVKNFKIYDTFYCYYIPNRASLKVDGKPSIDPNLIQVNTNPDGTKMITFEVPGGLKPDSDMEITYDAKLIDFNNFKLPIILEPVPNPIVLCSPHQNTPKSGLEYDWFTGEHITIHLY